MDGAFPPATAALRSYKAEMAAWRADPQAYWLSAARGIDWIAPPETGFRLRPDGHADWFPGGILNSCANALDRHVEAGRGSRTALIWDSPASGGQAAFSYAQLRQRVAQFAGGLRKLGVGKGDRVLIYMPPVPEAVIAMLACARLGAIHVVVFAGYAPAELARRIDDTSPHIVITASCAYTLTRPQALLPGLEEACGLAAHAPSAWVVLNRAACPASLRPGRDHDFHALEQSSPVPPVPLASSDPLYILHTSGTTGRPKGVVRDNGGHAVAIRHSMRLIYGIGPDDVFCATADLGWVVGHSYAVYGPLFAGCASVLFEGSATGTPDAGAIWRLCARHRVNILFTSPSAMRAMRQEDPDAAFGRAQPHPALRAVFVAGERLDRDTMGWGERASGVPVLDHWWQTETGWAIAGHFAGLADGLPESPAMRATPGFDLRVLDAAGHEVAAGEGGELSLRLPLPPGCFTGLWRNNTAQIPPQFPDYYRSSDLGSMDASGRATLISRLDDVLKVAGRRLSAGVIEDVLLTHPDVADCAVTGMPDRLRGEIPVAFVVLRKGMEDSAHIQSQLTGLVRERIGRFTGFRKVNIVTALPRTKSGKIIRKLLL